jgi:hypothetical protein
MKKSIFLLFILFSTSVFAKKVKFAVDMRDQEVHILGIHVAGDFQKKLGLPDNWLYDKTKLKQEKADTNIYSIVVDLPAFQKFEYKFVNGDQDYQVEFIPVESRVGYGFVTNRWIYIDSLANDTTFVGAIQFESNAPKDLTLLRVKVDMSNAGAIDKTGVHVAGSFQGWNPKTTRLYSFGNGVYEIISYVKTGTYEYKFYNGNINTTSEKVPTTCATNSNRSYDVKNHIVIPEICFSSCVKCVKVGVNDIEIENTLEISPNPSSEGFTLKNLGNQSQIEIFDVQGKKTAQYKTTLETYFIDNQGFTKGFYIVKVFDKDKNKLKIGKLIVE